MYTWFMDATNIRIKLFNWGRQGVKILSTYLACEWPLTKHFQFGTLKYIQPTLYKQAKGNFLNGWLGIQKYTYQEFVAFCFLNYSHEQPSNIRSFFIEFHLRISLEIFWWNDNLFYTVFKNFLISNKWNFNYPKKDDLLPQDFLDGTIWHLISISK